MFVRENHGQFMNVKEQNVTLVLKTGLTSLNVYLN